VGKGVMIGPEDEHACNIATGRETARLLAAVDHPNLRVVWDPANALVAGEVPYPDGYNRLPFDRIAHVHARDCRVRDRKVTFHAFGEGQVDWQGQIHALDTVDGSAWKPAGAAPAAISSKGAGSAAGSF
jgi:sugar phosphate isomerase/epimerase